MLNYFVRIDSQVYLQKTVWDKIYIKLTALELCGLLRISNGVLLMKTFFNVLSLKQ